MSDDSIYNRIDLFRKSTKGFGYKELGAIVKKSEAAMRMAVNRKSLSDLEIREIEHFFDTYNYTEIQKISIQIDKKFDHISDDELTAKVIKEHDRLLIENSFYQKFIEAELGKRVISYMNKVLKEQQGVKKV